MKRFQAAVLAFAICCYSLVAFGDENPMYKSWAKFNPGTSVTSKTVSNTLGQKTEMEIVTTLVKKSDDKVVLETKMVMVMAGNKMEMPSQQMEIPASMETPNIPGTVPDGLKPEIKEGNETIKIAGKEYKAKVIESKSVAGNMKVHSKSWTSDDVPGMMLKTVTKVEGDAATDSTMEVTEITIK